MTLTALHEYNPASALLTGSKRTSEPLRLAFIWGPRVELFVTGSTMLFLVRLAMSLYHLIVAGGLASAKHLIDMKLEESSTADDSTLGLVSMRTSGESEIRI